MSESETIISKNVVEQQARMLAEDNYHAEPDIEKVYWFPDEQEVRLVELTELIPISFEGEVQPFYFRASPQDDLPVVTAVAMIRPNEFGHLRLPDAWGQWDDAILIEAKQ